MQSVPLCKVYPIPTSPHPKNRKPTPLPPSPFIQVKTSPYHTTPLLTLPALRHSVSDTPGLQLVPAAMAMATLQLPLAQRWNAVPPTQFQAPSSAQGPDMVAAPPVVPPLVEPPPVVVPVPAGDAAEVVVVGEPPDAAEVVAGLVVVARVVGAEAAVVVGAERPVVMKTPPGREVGVELEGDCELVVGSRAVKLAPPVGVLVGDAELDELGMGYGAGGDDEDGEGESGESTYPDGEPAPMPVTEGAAVVVADEPLPLPEPEPLPPAAAAWQVPVGLTSLEPWVSTSGPGSGKMTSLPSSVPQPLPMLAVKTAGREAKAVARLDTSVWRLEAAPPMVTLAQFMYISVRYVSKCSYQKEEEGEFGNLPLLPTSLNQVQANSTSLPAGASVGTVKSKEPPVAVGHSPTMLWMTVKVLPLS